MTTSGIGLLHDVPFSHPFFPPEDVDLILERIEAALRAGAVRSGVHVTRFEEAVAASISPDVRVVALNSATTALQAIYMAINVSGGEVIVPANTFVATASAAVHAGADVRFVDIDPAILAPTVEMIDEAITPRTRAVMICHMGGAISPSTPDIVRLCRERGIPCVEDAAQAQGARLDGRIAGSFGDAAVFSYFPTKVITAGEGGVVVTPHAEIADHVSALRDQGRDSSKVYRWPGFNWRMPEMSAIVAEVQMARLDSAIAKRSAVANTYTNCLGNLEPMRVPGIPSNSEPNWYSYWITLADPVHATSALAGLRHEHGFNDAGPLQGHNVPCHLLPPFASLRAMCPNTEHFCASHLGLPIYPDLTDDQVRRVAEAVGEQVVKIQQA